MGSVPRIVLLGATGQVGWELCRSLSVIGTVIPVSRAGNRHHHLDLADSEALTVLLDGLSPDVIVNAAAYTAVDRAESERELAFALNATLPGVIGQWAERKGVPVVHYSTDYVFDGSSERPYTEQDPAAPVSVYGESKWAGDQALLNSGAEAFILRVSWVYGGRGGNFLLTMKRLMAERESLNIVDDQHGAPTWSRSIAEASAMLLVQRLHDPERYREASGVYHLSPGGETTWFGFASAIRDALQLDCALSPIPTSAYPTPASRPENSRMDASRLQSVFGISLPSWQSALHDCLDL